MASTARSRMIGDAVVAYHPDSHVADRLQVKGRHSAGAGFLRAFLAYAEVDRFRFQVQTTAHREHLKQQLPGLGPLRRPVDAFLAHRPDKIAGVGSLQLAGPLLSEEAWSRRALGDRAYSICGLTHTISSVRVLEAFGEYLTAPVQPWDALICTSRVVRDEVQNVLDTYAEYLAGRTGARPTVAVRLPVIPLGVDAGRYTQDPARRTALRARIGAGEADLVILFLGRLSFHAKANPLPLILAASRAARATAKRLHVLFVGQFPNPGIKQDFQNAAKFAEAVQVHFLPGEDPDTVEGAWRGADVFASLSDNIQESFGLTVVEAMAAGLPVVASDWDGYRDTVEHGVTGFLVPTLLAAAGAGEDLAERHRTGVDTYDRYIGNVALGTAVNVGAAAQALVRLADDEALRNRMGAAGRAAARDRFDWRHVVRAHQTLWAELAEVRASSAGLGVRGREEPAHPLHRDPFVLFGPHPTQRISAAAQIRLDDPSSFDRLFTSGVAANGIEYLLLPRADIERLTARLGAGPLPVSTLLNGLGPDQQVKLFRTLAWLAKFGVVWVEEPAPSV